MSQIPASPTPLVLEWLVEQISTQVDNSVLVSLGPPGTYRGPSMINVGCSTNGKEGVRRRLRPFELVGGGGAGYLEETIEIDVTVSCWSGDQDPSGVSATAWRLVSIVENTVRSNLTLGGNVNQSQPLSTSGGTPEWTDPAGHQVDIVVTIEALNPL